MNASKPIIGLTSYRQQAQTGVWDVEASFLPAVYLDAVTTAGGIAVLLPPQPADDDAVDAVLDRIDGLIVVLVFVAAIRLALAGDWPWA